MWPFSKDKAVKLPTPCYGCGEIDSTRRILWDHSGVEHAFCYYCICEALCTVLKDRVRGGGTCMNMSECDIAFEGKPKVPYQKGPGGDLGGSY